MVSAHQRPCVSVPRRAVTLVLHAVINFLPTRVLGILNGFSVCWHVAGAFALIILLPAVAPTHQGADFVFTTFYQDDATAVGAPSCACAPFPQSRARVSLPPARTPADALRTSSTGGSAWAWSSCWCGDAPPGCMR